MASCYTCRTPERHIIARNGGTHRSPSAARAPLPHRYLPPAKVAARVRARLPRDLRAPRAARLRALRRAQGAAQGEDLGQVTRAAFAYDAGTGGPKWALRLFRKARRLLSVELHFWRVEQVRTVLLAVPCTVGDLDLSEFRVGRVDGAGWEDLAQPSRRRLRLKAGQAARTSGLLMATITKSPKLEQLSLYYRDSRNVDFSGILGPEVVTRITECKIWNITSFVRLCADPAFRPRLIFDISDTIGRSSLEDEAKDMLAAIAGLPSVESLDLGRLTSRCIVERGLPPNLCELKLDELLLNARTVANGVARITELLQSRPQLTIKIRRFSHWESTSPAEIAEGESWDRAIVRSGKRAR